ncbi:MAG: hypothetical protein ACP5KN_10875 [Armatimonadota bacterium]
MERWRRQLKSPLQIAAIHLHNGNRLYVVVWLYVVALMVLSLPQLLALRAIGRRGRWLSTAVWLCEPRNPARRELHG